MSTRPGSVNYDGSERDLDYKDGLAIGGIIFLFLICMVALKLFCNAFVIDLILLQDFEAFKRSVGEMWRTCCPCWHRRTQPQETIGTSRDSDNDNDNNAQQGLELVTMEQIFDGLTQQQRRDIVCDLLTTKTVNAQDLQNWKEQKREHIQTAQNIEIDSTVNNINNDDNNNYTSREKHGVSIIDDNGCNDISGQENNNNDLIVCSICIHSIEIGDELLLLSCNHYFHKECLCDWLVTEKQKCPYCRTEIITQEMLQRLQC